MSFALTYFEAEHVKLAGPGPRWGIQAVQMTVTGLAADVDLDIGDDAGTFWTAAIADATYGDLATSALASLKKILAQGTVSKVYSPEIDSGFRRAAAAGAGVYAFALQDKRPNWTFNAAEGLTSYTIFIEYYLNQNILPVAESYGTGV
jgi:hypothetical protein